MIQSAFQKAFLRDRKSLLAPIHATGYPQKESSDSELFHISKFHAFFNGDYKTSSYREMATVGKIKLRENAGGNKNQQRVQTCRTCTGPSG